MSEMFEQTIATRNKCIAIRNKCLTSSNRCLTSSNQKLLVNKDRMDIFTEGRLLSEHPVDLRFGRAHGGEDCTKRDHAKCKGKENRLKSKFKHLLLLVRHLLLIAFCYY